MFPFFPLVLTTLLERRVRRVLVAAAQALAESHHTSELLDDMLPRCGARRPPRRYTNTASDPTHAANTGTGTDRCDLTPETDPDGPLT